METVQEEEGDARVALNSPQPTDPPDLINRPQRLKPPLVHTLLSVEEEVR